MIRRLEQAPPAKLMKVANPASSVTIISGGPGTRRNFFAKNSMLDIKERIKNGETYRSVVFMFESEPQKNFRVPVELETIRGEGNWEVSIFRLDVLKNELKDLPLSEKENMARNFLEFLRTLEGPALVYFENPMAWITAVPARVRDEFMIVANNLVTAHEDEAAESITLSLAVNCLLEVSVIENLGQPEMGEINQAHNYFLLPNPGDSLYPMVSSERDFNLDELFITEVFYLSKGLPATRTETHRWLDGF